MQKLLPAIRNIAGDVFVFQQDNSPAHRACDRVELLRCETPQFISPDMWPANSPDLNPVDNRVWGMLQECMIEYQSAIRTSCGRVLLRHGPIFSRAWWMMRLISGDKRLEACIRAEGGHFCAVTLLASHSSCHT